MHNITIKEEDKTSASHLNKLVPEFYPTYIEKHFDKKVQNKKSLILGNVRTYIALLQT